MRVRDLRWYILACLVLIASYAGIAICFYLSISNGKVESSMKTIGLNDCKNEVQILDSKFDEYYQLFTKDLNDTLVYTTTELVDNRLFEKCPNQTGLANKFNNIEGNKIIYAQSLQFEAQPTDKAPNSDYYFYFYKKSTTALADTNGDLVCRISSSNFFSNIED